MPSSRRSANSKSSRPRVRYLSYDDLGTIAYKLAERLFTDWLGPMPVLAVLGGEEGAGRVDGILQLPRQSAAGRAAYPSLYDKAAALFRSFILNHPFIDGNKRMATAVALVFLDVNDHIVCAAQQEMVDLALTVASGESKELRSIASWFRVNSVQLSGIRDAVATDSVGSLVAALPGGHRLEERVLLLDTVLELEWEQA